MTSRNLESSNDTIPMDHSFEKDTVLAQLERIMLAPDLLSSKRLSGFLGFVVREKLAGRSHLIKQFTIATQVFERENDFDQHNDPIVRVQAAKLRRILNRYYWEEGCDDPIRIEIPKGTYVPVFSHKTNQPSSGKSTTPLSAHKKLTVAVMPFTNQTGDDANEYLASGFAEDLATELSRFQEMAVIGYQTTSQFRSFQNQVCDLGRDLNADFVVTGSIRQIEPELRINAQVLDTQNSVQIWADRFHRPRSGLELFAIQDEILQHISARAFGTYGAIRTAKAQSSRRKNKANLTAYEAVLRALHYDRTMDSNDYVDALSSLRLAVENYPDYASARARLAVLQLDSFGFGFDSDGLGLPNGRANAERAVGLDPKSQDSQMAVSWANLLGKNVDGSARAARKMIELNPGNASMVGVGGWFLGLTGDRKRGMEIINHSRKLNPNCPTWFQLIAFLDEFENGRYENSLDLSQQLCVPDFFWDPMLKAATLGKLGRGEEAQAFLRKTVELRPDFGENAEFYIGCLVVSDELKDGLLDGLYHAGLGNKKSVQPSKTLSP